MMMWGYEKSFEDLLTHEYFLFASKVYARIAKVYFSRILALFKLTSLFTDYLFIRISYRVFVSVGAVSAAAPTDFQED